MSQTRTLDEVYLTSRMDDVSTSGSAVYIGMPHPGRVNGACVTLQAAITSADANLSFYHNDSTTSFSTIAVGNGTNGASAGDVFFGEFLLGVAKGDVIHVGTDGGSTGVAPADITLITSKLTGA